MVFSGKLCLSIELALGALVFGCGPQLDSARSAPLLTPDHGQLTVSSFNIKYYGLGGHMNGHASDEKRDHDLKAFVASRLSTSDLIAFQEIVDVKRLKTKVVPAGWDCLSYPHSNPRHQHVVICHSPKFRFQRDPRDNNDVIETLAQNSGLRPALHTLVLNQRNELVARLVAVHLKAYPQGQSVRLQQASSLAKALKQMSPGVPTVVVGDFNTYPGNEKSIDQFFQKQALDLNYLERAEPFTFRDGSRTGSFDQVWASPELRAHADAQVEGPCNDVQSQRSDNFDDPKYYYSHVSDHCPITAEFEY